MNIPRKPSHESQVSEVEMPQGWQCCLLCGRTLTDRALHDALEEPVLASISAEHPEWSSVDGACQPCVRHYRTLLQDRLTREARQRAEPAGRRANWVNRLLGYRVRVAGFLGGTIG